MATGFLQIENIPLNEVERWKEIIGILLEKGVFTLKNGSAILRFDDKGLLQEVEVNQKRYKRGIENLQNFEKFATIKTNTPT